MRIHSDANMNYHGTNKQNVSYSFKTFVKYGVIIALPTITVALLGLLIVL